VFFKKRKLSKKNEKFRKKKKIFEKKRIGTKKTKCFEKKNENHRKISKENETKRKALHVAAVFVCNFVNHLYKIGHTICKENKLSFDILKPLIKETAEKITHLTPTEAQTGPAKRNDTTTINTHLNFLTDENEKEIYKIITKSIIDDGKKL
jgi:hypothetical protein